uniref:Dihydrolipoamide acetyltransferase family protein n=1 Tax=Desertifilum tharense IPPAS B-1220 TaxID=1781255 RepID=A0ACD5GW88_9CYAN
MIAETEAEIETAKQQSAQKSAPQPVAASTSYPGTRTGTANPQAPELTQPVAETATQQISHKNGRTIASPRARKLAKELKVDLSTLQGSGLYGRIVAEDVESAVGRAKTAPPYPVAPQPTPQKAPTPAAPALFQSQAVPLNTLQNAVVRNMVASLQVPTYRVGYTITTDALDGLYKQIKSKGVTMTALLAKAIAVTLQKHPLINSSYTDQGVVYHNAINIAVAVAMDDGGLITPVLRNADQADIYSLSRTWKDLVERSRTKQLQPEEYSTGTFTLSNLGMFGVDRFDAILPAGQGAILAVGASRPQVVATEDGLLGVRRQMQVNITCDHRMIYGAHAAAFLKDLAKLIEQNPQSLTL